MQLHFVYLKGIKLFHWEIGLDASVWSTRSWVSTETKFTVKILDIWCKLWLLGSAAEFIAVSISSVWHPIYIPTVWKFSTLTLHRKIWVEEIVWICNNINWLFEMFIYYHFQNVLSKVLNVCICLPSLVCLLHSTKLFAVP